MNSESLRIADQLRRAYTGEPWHGLCIQALLHDVTAEQALARPLRAAHSIWELVLHCEIYVTLALDALDGRPMPKLYGTEQDWPTADQADAPLWTSTQDQLFFQAEQLCQVIEGFPDDARLQEIVPGRQYNVYHLLHGIVQHSLYHAGQIAVLKRG